MAVFKLISVSKVPDSDLVDLTYRLLFGNDFSDQHPVASDQQVTTNEDTPISIILSGTDLESCELTFLIVEFPSNGGLTSIFDNPCVPSEPNSDSASVIYLPRPDFNGIDRFTYRVIDGNGEDIGTINVTINVVNDAPSFTVEPNQTVDEDSGPQTVTNWATNISAGPDNESDQKSNEGFGFDVTVDDNDKALFSVLPAVSNVGRLTYTAAANTNGEATVTVKLVDGGGKPNGGEDTSLPTVFTIFVNPFQNGSFELNPNDANTFWSVDFGDIDWLPNTVWLPSDGSRSIDLNGFFPGTISQTFATVKDQDYIVLFKLSKNNLAPPTVSITVTAADSSQDYSFSTTTTGGLSGNMHWTEKSFKFTATDNTTKLTFKSNTGGASGPTLDNVRLKFDHFPDN